VTAITGSVGKTTTKEFLRDILGSECAVAAAPKSFNNRLGVALTLLEAGEETRHLVVEMGTSGKGELSYLSNRVRPERILITTVTEAHIKGLGDLAGVIEEEGALAEALPPEGCLFVNGDIEGLEAIRARCRATVVTVGEGEDCDWQLTGTVLNNDGTTFELLSPKGDWSGAYRVNLLGHQNARNAALAIALAAELGLSREELDQGLQCCRPASMRMEMQTLGGVRIINDAYNSNPDSLLAALETMGLFPTKGKRIAILGDMAELGEASEFAHVEVGRLAARLGLDGLVAVGQWANKMVRAAQEDGLANVAAFDDINVAGQALAVKLSSGDLVLIKGSRAARMERIIEPLKEAMKP